MLMLLCQSDAAVNLMLMLLCQCCRCCANACLMLMLLWPLRMLMSTYSLVHAAVTATDAHDDLLAGATKEVGGRLVKPMATNAADPLAGGAPDDRLPT